MTLLGSTITKASLLDIAACASVLAMVVFNLMVLSEMFVNGTEFASAPTCQMELA